MGSDKNKFLRAIEKSINLTKEKFNYYGNGKAAIKIKNIILRDFKLRGGKN